MSTKINLSGLNKNKKKQKKFDDALNKLGLASTEKSTQKKKKETIEQD